jgi:uncharacterized protein (AIM24 family)
MALSAQQKAYLKNLADRADMVAQAILDMSTDIVISKGDVQAAVKSILDGSELSDGSFDSVLEAHNPGAAGDDLQFELVGDAAGVATKAFLDLGTLGNGKLDTIVESHLPGVAGNSTRVALVGDSVAVKAELDLGTLGSGALDTVIESHLPGVAGNSTRVSLIGDSGGGQGVTISRANADLTIHYESGVSTVALVEAAIAALADGDDLIDVKTAGTGATVLTAPGDNIGELTALAGGSDSPGVTIDRINADVTIHFDPGVSTVTNVETAIAALAGGDDLIDIKTAGTGATVLDAGAAFVLTALADGTDNDPVSITVDAGVVTCHFLPDIHTVAQVEAAIAALAGAADIIDVKTPGTGATVLTALSAFQAENLWDGSDISVLLTGHIVDGLGNHKRGVRDLKLDLLASSGTAKIVDGGSGSVKAGSGTASAWMQTDETGKFEALVSNTDENAEMVFSAFSDNGDTCLMQVLVGAVL